ncbi:MAG TPA: sugar kinase [Casimicrobiaceae bacterium]|jgi:2-dehydro-3-deoxygluconokinase
MDGGLDVLAMGEALVEFNQARPDDPRVYVQGFGGDTSNMAIAAARLGARAGYLTRIGDDLFGQWLLELWRDECVDTQAVAVDAAHPTGIYFVTHGERGHAFSYRRAGSAASHMARAALPVDAIRATRFLHLSAISQAISASAADACAAAVAIAREAGVQVVYDTNLRLKLWPLARARDVIRATLRSVDWALPSLDDVREIYAIDDADAIIDAVLADGARNVVLKQGAQGCTLAAGGQRRHIAGHAVAAVDATGAGDCFDGAFVARLCRGDDPADAAAYANAAAALSTQGFGAVAPLPRHAEVAALAGIAR